MRKDVLLAWTALCLLSRLSLAASGGAAGPVAAGDTLLLSGKVLDKQTGRPVAYAAIGIRGKAIGTITNEEGRFDFYLPGGRRSDTVFVTCLGYVGFEATVGSLPAKNLAIALEPATYTLREAVVKGRKGLTAEQIVRKARQKITDNYPVTPYKLEAYYRKYQKVNGRYVYFTDAALEVYDQGYQRGPGAGPGHREQVVLRETRQSHYQDPKPYENALDREKRYLNSIDNCLFRNAVRYRNESLQTGHYTYRLDSVVRQDTSTFYLITARIKHHKYMRWHQQDNTRKPAYQLYIHTGTFAIHRIEYAPEPMRVDCFKDAQHLMAVAGNDSIRSYLLGSEARISVEFKSFRGVLFPHYILIYLKFNDYNVPQGKERFTNEYQDELLVNNIHTEGVQAPDPARVMQRDKSLESQLGTYNPQFWKRYNAIKLAPLDERLITQLEAGLTLEEQFRKRTRMHLSKIDAKLYRTQYYEKKPGTWIPGEGWARWGFAFK
ncbi:MAG: carboxypeptidase-like regulatory domain-containing protein [Cytophagales bacterium]|nr:carboxypeptidase-like regulatory domain-containing protein [Cytophagales bacterium]